MKKDFKRVLMLTIIMIIALSAGVFATGKSETIEVSYPGFKLTYFDSEVQTMDNKENSVNVFSYKGKSYAPLSSLLKQFGVEFKYDDKENIIRLKYNFENMEESDDVPKAIAVKNKPTEKISVTFINPSIANEDDDEVIFEDQDGNMANLFIYNGTVYAPIRTVAYTYGYDTMWDEETNTINIGYEYDEYEDFFVDDIDVDEIYNSIDKVYMPAKAVVTSTLSAEKAKQSKKYLLDVSKKLNDVKNYSMDMDMSIKVGVEKALLELNPHSAESLVTPLNIINKSSLSAKYKVDIEKYIISVLAKYLAPGITMDVELYMDSLKGIIAYKVPFLSDKYFVNNSFNAMNDENTDIMLAKMKPVMEKFQTKSVEIVKRLNSKIADLIPDSAFVSDKFVDRKISGSDARAREIAITFSTETFYNYLLDTLDLIFSDEEFINAYREYMTEISKISYSMYSDDSTTDESSEKLDEESRDKIDELLKMLTDWVKDEKENKKIYAIVSKIVNLDGTKIIYYIDTNHNLIGEKVIMDIEVNNFDMGFVPNDDEANASSDPVKLLRAIIEMDAKIGDFGTTKVKEIEFNEKNSKPMFESMFGSGF